MDAEGATCVLAAVGPRLVAAFAVTDPLKPEAPAVVAALQRLGLRCHMVTGDGWVTARAISARLGIVDVSAEVGAACCAVGTFVRRRRGAVGPCAGQFAVCPACRVWRLCALP